MSRRPSKHLRSKSVVQVDIDARCEKPSNFNDFFFGRRLNCRNMLRRGPPPRVVPAMACPSAQNVSDLVVEKCSWHCKHKRPVSRCFISFDPRNALGVQQKLDKCWIQEKCINNQMKAKTTCQTAPSSSTPAVTLAGSMLVTVTDPVTFLAQPNLQFALQDAIERMAPESDFSDVAIEIPSSNSLANKTKMVKVGFNASVKGNDDETSDEKALGAEMALQNISHDALVDAVNGALSSEGLTNLVEDAMLLLAPLKLKGPRSEDFESLVAMMHLYQKHLEEVRLELQEVQEDLTIQNLSHKDAEALREKHRSTQKRLSSIMASQEKMSQYIEDAVSKHPILLPLLLWNSFQQVPFVASPHAVSHCLIANMTTNHAENVAAEGAEAKEEGPEALPNGEESHGKAEAAPQKEAEEGHTINMDIGDLQNDAEVPSLPPISQASQDPDPVVETARTDAPDTPISPVDHPAKPGLPALVLRKGAGRRARDDARRRIIAAREDLERRVAEATEARLKRQAEAEAEARARAEQAQQRARRRLAEKKKKKEEAQEAEKHQRSQSSGAESHSPRELPGIKPAKARVKKKIQKQREEQEQRLREIEEDRERTVLRKKTQEEAAEAHRLQAARRAAERWRREREAMEKVKAEREEEVQQARERQKWYRNPKQIARLISEAHDSQAQAEERRRAAREEESYLRHERERARRHVDGELEERPFGARRPGSKTEISLDDENFLAKTVQALTDEDWKVNIKFS
ncbi:unnamed protein product [Durusdinium trenchii]|uniref:Uncharacterized protein n=3 Tax=Durusdinium trenchii TaxID=1381693 RepID=A0ABP0LEL1_9DINO